MTLLDALAAKPPPLRIDEQGAVRVGKTRATLDTVIGAHQSGCTAEDIARKYPSLELADVYAVITYYLWYPGKSRLIWSSAVNKLRRSVGKMSSTRQPQACASASWPVVRLPRRSDVPPACG